jgi:hypothetical protein
MTTGSFRWLGDLSRPEGSTGESIVELTVPFHAHEIRASALGLGIARVAPRLPGSTFIQLALTSLASPIPTMAGCIFILVGITFGGTVIAVSLLLPGLLMVC